jgi:hypothetical protein
MGSVAVLANGLWKALKCAAGDREEAVRPPHANRNLRDCALWGGTSGKPSRRYRAKRVLIDGFKSLNAPSASNPHDKKR